MSVKRQATTELNHDNWDQDDPSEKEEIGSFKAAPKEVLEKRVIRTAKRRSQVTSDEPRKGVFSGFGGFNKTQPSSFDFLANLTNGNKSSPSANKSDTTVTSTIFNNSPISSNGIFGVQASTDSKPMFGLGSSQTPAMFGISNSSTTTSSLFTASKADSTVSDSPFKIQSPSSGSTNDKSDAKTPNVVSQVSSTMFGGQTTNSSSKLFMGTPNSSPFAIKSSTPPSGQSALLNSVNSKKHTDCKEINYCAKLKGLNEAVCAWIKKHIEETPFCILSPIFKDYEKYLKEIQNEYFADSKEHPAAKETTESPLQNQLPKSTGFSLGSTLSNSDNKPVETKGEAPKPGGFGIPLLPTAATSSPFSTNTNGTTSNGTASAPFSFGIGKPFSFNNVQTTSNTETSEKTNEDEDSPPKVEYTPIVEENSVYEQKCKVFVKKDGNFVDKGVGTLYIKKIEENGKHQLLVRANTSLGNVLVNLILASVIPTQRMGKNNVMMVCIPTPDFKPPPVPILIRVKTSEEADELLETLNKYKT